MVETVLKSEIYDPLSNLFMRNTNGMMVFAWDQVVFVLRNAGSWIGKYDQLYRFNGLIYEPVLLETFSAQLNLLFEGRPMTERTKYSTGKAFEVYKQLYNLSYLDHQELNVSTEFIPFQDGFYNWRTRRFYMCGCGFDFAGCYFTDTLHVRFMDRSGIRHFLYLLGKLVPKEDDQQKILRFFAYTLLTEANNSRYHQLWYGKGNNGKTQLAEHWGDLLGNWCAHIGLNKMIKDDHSMVGLRGVHLNICNEIGALATGVAAIETLKSVTTDKFIAARDLYESQRVCQTTNICRQLATTNNTPYSESMAADEAFFSRWELIEFPYEWDDADWAAYKDDVGSTKHTFDQIFALETPGIIHLVLSFIPEIGLLQIDAKETLRGWASAGNSAIAFIHSDVVDDEGDSEKRPLFDHYKAWCTKNDRKPLGYNVFFKILKNRGHTEMRAWGEDSDGQKYMRYYIEGIRCINTL